MPVEQAFFCFVALCDRYIKDYYNPGLVRRFFFTGKVKQKLDQFVVSKCCAQVFKSVTNAMWTENVALFCYGGET